MVDASLFNCPNCNGLYQVVKVEAPPLLNEDQLTCLSCGGPLNALEGRFVLKYFFIDRRSARAKPLSARKLRKGEINGLTAPPFVARGCEQQARLSACNRLTFVPFHRRTQ
jgi:hypothetical protein